MVPKEKSEEMKGKIQCPICGMAFEKLDDLIRHLREESGSDHRHQILLTAYYSISVHIREAIGRLFSKFQRRLRELEVDAKNLKRPSEEEVKGVVKKIEAALSLIGKPTDIIEQAVCESVIMSIRGVLQWRQKTKSDLLRIISSINSILTEGRKAYVSMLIKAARILAEKHFTTNV